MSASLSWLKRVLVPSWFIIGTLFVALGLLNCQGMRFDLPQRNFGQGKGTSLSDTTNNFTPLNIVQDAVVESVLKSPAVKSDLIRLKTASGASFKLHLRPLHGTPMRIQGSHLRGSNTGPVKQEADRKFSTARAFLVENQTLLGVENPGEELQHYQTDSDDLGFTHVRFCQFYHGLPVWPAEVAVHLDSQGNVVLFEGAYVATPKQLNVVSTISNEQAVQIARDYLQSPNAILSSSQLIIYAPMDQQPQLMWKIEILVDIAHHWRVLVDATQGAAVKKINLCHESAATGSGVDTSGITRSLNITKTNSTYYMIDTSKSMYDATTGSGIIEVEDARNYSLSQIIYDGQIQNTKYVTSTDPNSWNNPAAVSAAFNFSQTYDYYLERHERNSFNGQKGSLKAIVRVGGLANAFWQPVLKVMVFGTGDNYAGSLDVVAHEITHGVIDSTGPNGILDYENQSGALNEAFADILGEMVEARAKGGIADWIMGSQLTNQVRNMSNPPAMLISGTQRPYPDRMSKFIPPNDAFWDSFSDRDNGGVHINSEIINKAYYLLANGMPGAIGIPKAEKIFYRCLTVHLRPQSQFIDTRLGCVSAAEELYGTNSVEVLSTQEAFDTIELYDAPASIEPDAYQIATVNSPDSVLEVLQTASNTNYYSLYRWEDALTNSPVLITNRADLSRPSITGDGTKAAFVDGLYNLCFLNTSNRTVTSWKNFSYRNSVHSTAVSPDGTLYAVVPYDYFGYVLNQIVLYYPTNNQVSTVSLVTPVADGSPVDNIAYADAMTFSPNGQQLIYDAQSSIVTASGETKYIWSMYQYDVAKDKISIVTQPASDEDVGNPSFSRTSNRFITYESVLTNGDSKVYVMNLISGEKGMIAYATGGIAYPCFTGDDLSVIYASADTNAASGHSLWKQTLSSDRLAPVGEPIVWRTNALLGVTYRRGFYTNVNHSPSIVITNPVSGNQFRSPASVTVGVQTADLDGSLVRVEYYLGSKKVGQTEASPWSFELNSLSAGVYHFYARAFDDLGAAADSEAVQFTVMPPQDLAFSANRYGNSGLELRWQVSTQGLYRIEASTNMVDWISIGDAPSQDGLFIFNDPDVSHYEKRFYRLRNITLPP